MRRRSVLGIIGTVFVAGCSSDPASDATDTRSATADEEEDSRSTGTVTDASTPEPTDDEPAFTQVWSQRRGPERPDKAVVGNGLLLWQTRDPGTNCLDLASGEQRWSSEQIHGNSLYPTDDRIYALPSGENAVEALDRDTGEAQWTVPLSEVIGEGAVEGARASGLALPVPDGVAVSANGLEESGSAILDGDTGEILARIRQDGQRRQLSNPTHDGEQLFTSTGRPRFFAYDLEAREVQWSLGVEEFTTGSPGQDGFAAGPERVFTPAQTRNSSGQSAVPARAYDRATGGVEWEVDASERLTAPYGYAAGTLVFVGGREAVGVEPDTGEVRWTHSHGSRPVDYPAITDRAVVVLEQGGPLIALDPQSGDELSRVDVAGRFVEATDSYAFLFDASTDREYVCYRY